MLKFVVVITILIAIYDTTYTVTHEIYDHKQLSYFAFLHLLNIALVIGAILHLLKDHKRDVQQLKEKIFHVQRTQQKTEEYSGFLLENLPSPISIVSPHYNLLRINHAVTELTGVKPSEIEGKKCYELFGAGDVCEGCPVKRALLTKRVQQNVKRELTRTDKEIYIQQTAVPVIDDNGSVLNVIEIINDVTEKVKLEQENRSLFVDTVTSFAGLIDSRDSSTGKHSHRVKDISLFIGQELGLSAGALEELSITALLHDIGKIGIPEQILNKCGRLTPEEYEIIKQHPITGYNNLFKIKPLEKIAGFVLHHHEKYDGTGYPHGLKGDDIPLISRILAVADVYEAITADRVYRPAMKLEQALTVMCEGRNTFFDPVVLDAFFRYLLESESGKREIVLKYRDQRTSFTKIPS